MDSEKLLEAICALALSSTRQDKSVNTQLEELRELILDNTKTSTEMAKKIAELTRRCDMLQLEVKLLRQSVPASQVGIGPLDPNSDPWRQPPQGLGEPVKWGDLAEQVRTEGIIKK